MAQEFRENTELNTVDAEIERIEAPREKLFEDIATSSSEIQETSENQQIEGGPSGYDDGVLEGTAIGDGSGVDGFSSGSESEVIKTFINLTKLS